MAAGAIAAAATAAAAERATRKAIDDSNAAWSRWAASKPGFHFSPGTKSWATLVRTHVEGSVEGIAVGVQLLALPTIWGTAILGRPPAPLAGHLDVTEAGAIARIASFFGAEDHQTGDPVFDPAFTVKGTSAPLARELLTPEVRGTMLTLRAGFLGYDDGSREGHAPLVLFEVPRVLLGEAEIDRAVAAVVEVCRARPTTSAYR